MKKFRIYLYIFVFAVTHTFCLQLAAQTGTTSTTQQTSDTDHEEYSESALRRFEIITLSALPFTAIHSYIGVRGVKMITTNKISPQLTPENYRVMGITAVSLSLFIGIWDWLHTRNVDRSAPSVPGRKPPTPPTEEDETDGTIAGIPKYGTHANTDILSYYHYQLQREHKNTHLNRWGTKPTSGLVIPLIQVRF